jgi:hypothetical protein
MANGMVLAVTLALGRIGMGFVVTSHVGHSLQVVA